MTDRTTKLLLLAIAIGLWLNAAASFLRPVTVRAAADLDDIGRQLSSMASDLGRIQRGACTNDKIC
jgi:hypothetical protein